MKHIIATFIATVIVSACSATPTTEDTASTVAVLGLSIPLNNPSLVATADGKLEGWRAMERNRGGSYTFIADTAVVHSQPSSLRIRRHGEEIFGLLEQSVRIKPEWIRKTALLPGYLKSDKAEGIGGALILQARADRDYILGQNIWKAG